MPDVCTPFCNPSVHIVVDLWAASNSFFAIRHNTSQTIYQIPSSTAPATLCDVENCILRITFCADVYIIYNLFIIYFYRRVEVHSFHLLIFFCV